MDIVKKILAYAEEYRSSLYLAVALIFISVVISIVPYLLVYEMILRFIGKDVPGAVYILGMGAAVVAALVLQSVFYYSGLNASHNAAYDTLMGMRVKLADKMTRIPLGDVINKGTGSYKKNFVDDY